MVITGFYNRGYLQIYIRVRLHYHRHNKTTTHPKLFQILQIMVAHNSGHFYAQRPSVQLDLSAAPVLKAAGPILCLLAFVIATSPSRDAPDAPWEAH